MTKHRDPTSIREAINSAAEVSPPAKTENSRNQDSPAASASSPPIRPSPAWG